MARVCHRAPTSNATFIHQASVSSSEYHAPITTVAPHLLLEPSSRPPTSHTSNSHNDASSVSSLSESSSFLMFIKLRLHKHFLCFQITATKKFKHHWSNSSLLSASNLWRPPLQHHHWSSTLGILVPWSSTLRSRSRYFGSLSCGPFGAP